MANKLIHKRSSVITDNNPKLPQADSLEFGEMAINYADGYETISFKNTENEIIEFRSKKYFENIISENEEVVSQALNDLNTRVDTTQEAYAAADDALKVYVDELIDGLDIPTNLSELTNDVPFVTQGEFNSLYNTVNSKQDNISDLEDIRQGASKGATALQSYTEQYQGTVQSVETSETLDEVNTTTNVKYVAQTLTDAQKAQARANIGAAAVGEGGGGTTLTESDIAAMGFTKNTGTYSKPSGGIPKTDLDSSVQTSLGKADTALQSYTEQYKGTITGVSANGTSIATSGTANIPAASTSAYGVTKLSSATNSTSTTLAATASAVKAAYDLANGKQDKLISGTNIKTINGTSILGSGDIEISGGDYLPLTGGTITGDLVITSGNGGAGNFNAPHITADEVSGGKFLFDNDYWLRNEGYDLQYCDNNDEPVLTLTYKGNGTKFLSDDGTYKTVSGGSGETAPSESGLWLTEVIDNSDTAIITPESFVRYIYLNPLETMTFMGENMWYDNYNEYCVVFVSGENMTLTLPSYYSWANGVIPEIEPNTYYEMHVVCTAQGIYAAVLTPFKQV